VLNKTVDDEPICVCVLRILITKDKVLPFLIITCENTLQKFTTNLKMCGGTTQVA
jgi:hypothetical protein